MLNASVIIVTSLLNAEFTGSMTMDERGKVSKVMSCWRYRMKKRQQLEDMKNDVMQLTSANAQLKESINTKEQACELAESENNCLDMLPAHLHQEGLLFWRD
jgi:hypothetical protein